jgi:non-specific serine/threonine protein kinase
MADTLLELLEDRYLRAFAGPRVYERGVTYYKAGRVNIEVTNQQEATCKVRGMHTYIVSLWVHYNDLGATCSCPHAESGWFCKHMVAAGLAVREVLLSQDPSSWRVALSRVLNSKDEKSKRSPSKPFWFFLSLQTGSLGWILSPHTISLNKKQQNELSDHSELSVVDFLELVSHKRKFLNYVKGASNNLDPSACANCGPGVIAFSNIIRQQWVARRRYSHYASQNYPLAEYLSILSRMDIPLFLGDYRNPLRSPIQVLPDPAEMVLWISKTKSGVEIRGKFQIGELMVDAAAGNVEVITQSEPIWVLADRFLFQIGRSISEGDLYSWLQKPSLEIPREFEDEFLGTYFHNLADRYRLDGDQITWLDVVDAPVKRLYLSEEKGELRAELRFGYGDFEVPYDRLYPGQTIQRLPDAWTLVRIHRYPSVEAETYGSVSSATYGLKKGGKHTPENEYILRANIHPIDFLMRYVPRLTSAGFEIFGEEKLKTVRVNRHTPSLSFNVASGIDWFDVNAIVIFGEVETSLQEIRKAIRRKERYVKLADGTIGEIPEAWLQRYKHLFGLGEPVNGGIRLSNHHVTLIDQLTVGANQVEFDTEYQRRRRLLYDFSGIKPVDLPSGFVGELRPYQKAGYDWLHFLHKYDFGGCLADDMGLGKTIETLAFVQSLHEIGDPTGTVLVVLPRSLLINWQREAARFTPELRVLVYFGKDRSADQKRFDNFDLVLTTYGVMLRDIESLKHYRFHYVILDESQAIKNPLAKTSRAARLMSSDHRLTLTGTPVENSTFELWALFAFLNPGLFGNLEYFKREFGNPIEKNGDLETSQLLRKMVYPFILRRTKEQVAPELPPRTERIVYCDMEPAQRRFYNHTREAYRARLMGLIENQGMGSSKMQILEGLLRLRQICNHPKLVKDDFRGDSAKFKLLLELLATLRVEGHKALIFSQFVQMLEIVRREIDDMRIPYVYLDGQTHKRQERIDSFQNQSDIPFFLISLKAGGVGLNLTAADYVIHIDPWWNPAVEMQASDRTHRIGQDKPVFIYKLITRDSVEEKILQLQERKKALVEQLITTESSFLKNLTVEDINVLFS